MESSTMILLHASSFDAGLDAFLWGVGAPENAMAIFYTRTLVSLLEDR